MKMKAAVLRRFDAPQPFADSKPISIEEVTLDPPGPNEVLVRIGGAGLCHSDLSVMNGARPRPEPLVLGHEGAGSIVEVGSAITDVAPGDHIVFQFSPSCGRCRRCMEGRPQVCEAGAKAKAAGDLMGGGRRIVDADGNRIAHHTGVSCFAEYAVADRGSIVVIDKDLPLHEAALFGCAVMTGVGAVINTARILPGDTVAIIGLGGVGLNGVLGAKLAGAEVISTSSSDEKLRKLGILGSDHLINYVDTPEWARPAREISGGRGLDLVVEVGGAGTLEQSIKAVRLGGAVMLIGVLSGANHEFRLPLVVTRKIRLEGVTCGSREQFEAMLRAVDRNGLKPALDDQRFSLDTLPAAMAHLREGRHFGKVVVEI